MSKLDYSKWDNIELSDDEDIEVHKNIDKASFIRWRQADIHRKRDERKLRIEAYKQELETNAQLIERIHKTVPILRSASSDPSAFSSFMKKLQSDLVEYEKIKDKIFEEDADGHVKQLTTDQIFVMMISKISDEAKVKVNAEDREKLADVMLSEITRIEERQAELKRKLAEEEQEQNRKLTSDNICKTGFDKTILVKDKKNTSTLSTATSSKTTKEKSIEVLNPKYKDLSTSAPFPPGVKKEQLPEVDLRDLTVEEEKKLVAFSQMNSFEEAFRYLQQHPDIASRLYCDQLMARAFQLQIDRKDRESRLCVKWSLALSYSFQMGVDGIGLFFKRMTSGIAEAVRLFESDVESSYARVKERAAVLREKRESRADEGVTAENSNLTPEQAEAFNTFPKVFQDALMSNDMDKINDAFNLMGKEEAEEVMKKCQDTGLIAVLSEDEAKQYMDADEQSKSTTEVPAEHQSR